MTLPRIKRRAGVAPAIEACRRHVHLRVVYSSGSGRAERRAQMHGWGHCPDLSCRRVPHGIILTCSTTPPRLLPQRRQQHIRHRLHTRATAASTSVSRPRRRAAPRINWPREIGSCVPVWRSTSAMTPPARHSSGLFQTLERAAQARHQREKLLPSVFSPPPVASCVRGVRSSVSSVGPASCVAPTACGD